jgi:hypothetical protein
LRRNYAEPTFILLRESYCFSFFVERQVFLRELDQRVTILENWPSIKLATRRLTHHLARSQCIGEGDQGMIREHPAKPARVLRLSLAVNV